MRLDLEAISRNQKPSTAELSVDKPNAYLLISGNEQALTEQIMADIDYLRERTTAYAKSGSGKMHPIVDKKLAKEIQLWMRLQAKTAQSIEDLSRSWTFQEGDNTGRNTVGQLAKLASGICKTGATIQHANRVASLQPKYSVRSCLGSCLPKFRR